MQINRRLDFSFQNLQSIHQRKHRRLIHMDRSNITRNNGYNIVLKRFETNDAKYLFFNRVVNNWNGLPLNVDNSDTTYQIPG